MADDLSSLCIFLKCNNCILIKFSLISVPDGPTDNKLSLFRVMFCQLDHWKQTSVKSESKYKKFSAVSKKVQASMCQTVDESTHRTSSRFAPSQWETPLQSNAVSHWLGANLESALTQCYKRNITWRHHDMEATSALVMTLCGGNPPIISPGPVMRCFDVLLLLCYCPVQS